MSLNFDSINERLNKLTSEKIILAGSAKDKAKTVVNTLFDNISSLDSMVNSDKSVYFNLANEIAHELIQNLNTAKILTNEVNDLLGTYRDLIRDKKEETDKRIIEDFKRKLGTLYPNGNPISSSLSQLSQLQQLGKVYGALPPELANELALNGDPEFLMGKQQFLNLAAELIKSNPQNLSIVMGLLGTLLPLVDPAFQIPKKPEGLSETAFFSLLPEQLSKGLQNGKISEEVAQTAVANFAVLKEMMPDVSQAMSAAYYFAALFPGQALTANPDNMAMLLQQLFSFSAQTKTNFLNIPLPSSNFAEMAFGYQLAESQLLQSAKLAKQMFPELEYELPALPLTEEEVATLKNLNSMLLVDKELHDDLKKKLLEESPEDIGNLLAAYLKARDEQHRHLEEIKRILPAFDIKNAELGVLSDHKLTELFPGIYWNAQAHYLGKDLAPLDGAHEAAKMISEIEYMFLQGEYVAKEHEDAYKKTWQTLEFYLSKARQADPTFNPTAFTRELLPKNSLVDLEKRVHDVNEGEIKAKMGQLGAINGNWIITYDNSAQALLKISYTLKGVVEAAVSSKEMLKSMIEDLVNGLRRSL